MATFTAITFSNSTNGRPILADAVASPGTTIHTAATATGTLEEVYLDAYNTATADRILVIEFGSTATTSHLYATVPTQGGPYRVCAGLRLQGATGQVIRAFATATGCVVIAGGANQQV
jgi:hypothetical protein